MQALHVGEIVGRNSGEASLEQTPPLMRKRRVIAQALAPLRRKKAGTEAGSATVHRNHPVLQILAGINSGLEALDSTIALAQVNKVHQLGASEKEEAAVRLHAAAAADAERRKDQGLRGTVAAAGADADACARNLANLLGRALEVLLARLEVPWRWALLRWLRAWRDGRVVCGS